MDNAMGGIKMKVATLAVRTAEVLVRLKERTVRQELRRATAKLVHVKQVEEAEAGLVEALEPLIREQVEEAAKRLAGASGDDAGKLTDRIFDPSDWDAELIDRTFPSMATSMGEAALSVFAGLGVDARKSVKEEQRLAVGDDRRYNPTQPRLPAGSPQGGQWAGDGAGAPSPSIPAAVASPAGAGVVASESREQFLAHVINAPVGKLKLPKDAVDAFNADGNIEHLLGHEGRDGIVAERRARDKFGSEYGGVAMQKDAALNTAFGKSKAATDSLSDSERDAIGDYTMDFEVNGKLREGKKLTKEQQNQVDAVNKLVDSTGTWEQPGTIYHGIAAGSKEKDQFLAKAKEVMAGKGEWVESGILSNSADRKMSEEWMQRGHGEGSGVLMRIKTNKGAVVSHLSHLPGQEEVLMKPGTKLKPTSISTEKDSYGNAIAVIDFEAM